MKKLLFFAFLLTLACAPDPDEIGSGAGQAGPINMIHNHREHQMPNITNSNNAIDPGCHGGEWFESTNLAAISPWTYGEYATFTIKAPIPQVGLNGMGPVTVVYKLKMIAPGPSVSPSYILPSGPGLTINAQGGGMSNGSIKTITFTINPCVAMPPPCSPSGNCWYEMPLQVKFIKGPGSGTFTQLTGWIDSAVGGAGYAGFTEHKLANHDLGWTWSVHNP